jgi:hypothetical protein
VSSNKNGGSIMLNSWNPQKMQYLFAENYIPLSGQMKILKDLKGLQRAVWKKWEKQKRLCMFCASYDNYAIGLGSCSCFEGNEAVGDVADSEMMRKPNSPCYNKPRRGVAFISRKQYAIIQKKLESEGKHPKFINGCFTVIKPLENKPDGESQVEANPNSAGVS